MLGANAVAGQHAAGQSAPERGVGQDVRDDAVELKRLRRIAQRVDHRVAEPALVGVVDDHRGPPRRRRRRARRPARSADRRSGRVGRSRPSMLASHTSLVHTIAPSTAPTLGSSPSQSRTTWPGESRSRPLVFRQSRGRSDQVRRCRRRRARSSTATRRADRRRRRRPATATAAGGSAPRWARAAGSPTSAACDGGTPNVRRNARENTSGEDQPSSTATAATPSPRCSRHAARSSITRRRSAAGGSPVSRLTSREKWNSEA